MSEVFLSLARQEAREEFRRVHLWYFLVIPWSQAAGLGLLAGLLALPIFLGVVFGISILLGALFVLIFEGLFGALGLSEPVVPFLVNSLVQTVGMIQPHLTLFWMSMASLGVLGGLLGVIRQRAHVLRGERSTRSKALLTLYQAHILPWGLSALLVFLWGVRIGGLPVHHLIALGIMVGWFPGLLMGSIWLYALDLVLALVYRVRHTDPGVWGQITCLQAQTVLRQQRIDPRVRVVAQDGVIHLYGEVGSRDERYDAEKAVRTIPGLSGTISHLVIAPPLPAKLVTSSVSLSR